MPLKSEEDKKQPGPLLDKIVAETADDRLRKIEQEAHAQLMEQAKARVAAREAEEAKLSAINNPLDYIGRIEALEVNHRKQQQTLRQCQEALGNIQGVAGGYLATQAREGFQNLTNRYAIAVKEIESAEERIVGIIERAAETRRRRAAAAKKKARKR